VALELDFQVAINEASFALVGISVTSGKLVAQQTARDSISALISKSSMTLCASPVLYDLMD
jgi:hypothetical protein